MEQRDVDDVVRVCEGGRIKAIRSHTMSPVLGAPVKLVLVTIMMESGRSLALSAPAGMEIEVQDPAA